MIKPDNATPLLQFHYKTFITTTGCSAPVLSIGTQVLAVRPLGLLLYSATSDLICSGFIDFSMAKEHKLRFLQLIY